MVLEIILIHLQKKMNNPEQEKHFLDVTFQKGIIVLPLL